MARGVKERLRLVPTLIGLGIGALFAADGRLDAAGSREPLNLEVMTTTPKSSIVLCEPLVVDLCVRNTGKETVHITTLFNVALRLRIEIRGPGPEVVTYGPFGVPRGALHQVALGVNEVYMHRLLIGYGALRSGKQATAGFPFAVAGEYEVIVSYLPRYVERDDPWFKAPPLQVTVTEPEGREKEALALFRGKAQGIFLHMWDMHAVGPPPEFAQLAKQYPDTVYGRYARFFRAAAVVGFDWAEARETFAVELAGLDRADAQWRLLEQVRKKRASEFADLARSEPPFPLADQCLLYQAECYLNSRANRRTEAVKVLRDLVAKYPESPVAVKAKKRLEKLGTKAPAPTTSPPSP